MKLVSARITNYKCVEDSREFAVDQVTCLVGKNESGKSTILQALYKLNPAVQADADFNDVVDYPRRHWSRYKERKHTVSQEDNVLSTGWKLEQDDLSAIARIVGPHSLKSSTVQIEKGYDNDQYWSFDIDEEAVLSHLVSSASLYQEELEQLRDISTLVDLIRRLQETPNPSDRQENLRVHMETTFPGGSIDDGIIRILEKRLPRFVYFADYHRLPGQVSLSELLQKGNTKNHSFQDRVFLALLDLAGTNLQEFNEAGRFEEFVAELEAVSNRLTDTIFNYWSQNTHLEVEFRLDNARPQDPPPFNSGYVFRTRIRNSRHRVTVGFDERSTGFVWFFSFLVWFSQLRKNYGDNLFILLDEPGLNLHARAQQDLLRYISECLRPVHQVMYTTHSPFLIDPENLLSVRTVEDMFMDGKVEGTKVGDQVFSTDADTLFPLQAALGYELTQTLFVGKNVLLVEGPSDLLYLKWFSWELEQRGRQGLDKRWVVTPCGGIDKVGSFVTLFGGNRLNVAVLTDFHEGDKKKIRTLRESDLLKHGHIFSAEMFVDQNEADIEDIVGRSLYVDLVNRCFRLGEAQCMSSERRSSAPVRVVKEAEQHFAALPLEAPQFDHFSPASFLLEAGVRLRADLPGVDEAVARFERLFRDLNALIPKQ